MKKRLFTSVLAILLLVVLSVFGFVGCGKDGGTVESSKSSESVESSETVDSSESSEMVDSSESSEMVDSSESSETVDSSEDQGGDIQIFTVEFKNGDKVIKSVEVEEGSSVAYSGVTPFKASTAQYTYTFSGWSTSENGEAVDLSTVEINGDTTFYAVFVETIRSYTVTWNVDGATTTESVEYGATPEYKGATPTKPTVGNTSYTFMGWAASLTGEALETLPAVDGDATYYAVFNEVTEQTTFSVIWKNGNDLLQTDTDVEYEATPIYTGETPTKDPTVEIEYVFDGWSTSLNGEKLETLPAVTADATYYAVFKETPRKYTITWMIEGVEHTSQCGYGSVPTYTGATPTKADSEECSYKFSGWALSVDGEKTEPLPTVAGEATFYAVFEVDQIFEAPKFTSGQILYSANSKEIFLPEGLLPADVSITSAVVKAEGMDDVVAYQEDAWVHEAINLTEEELKENMIGVRFLEVKLSNGEKYGVDMKVYSGIIDELSDFPVFFNNTAVPSEFDAATYPAVAPNVYGYYIVTKDLGTGVEELTFEQAVDTDFQKTNGFNGVLDGQGHTLRFKLMKGALVGRVLGNAVIKNLGVIYEDCSYDGNDKFNTGHGVFGYITNGYPEIRNCYIERTNELYSRSSVYGIMARPNNKLTIHNSVIFGYNVKDDCTWWTDESNGKFNTINETSTNVYVIHARNVAPCMSVNFTKVFDDAIWEGSREVLLSEIADASGFDDNFWYKENGKLIWKGFETATITWVDKDGTSSEFATKGDFVVNERTLPEDVITETQVTRTYWSTEENGEQIELGTLIEVQGDVTYYLVENVSTRYYTVTWNIEGEETTTDYEYNETAAHDDPVKAEDDYYTYEFKGWSLSENGEIVELGAVTADDITYYAVFEKTAKVSVITVNEAVLYSSADDQIFLPEELTLTLDETVTISSTDGTIVYYENGTWVNNFDLTDAQIKANEIGLFEIAIEKDADLYIATVKSYAGVIDELSDFPKFFNNEAVPSEFDAATYPAVAPNVYGYYIVTKNLGDGSEELAFTQTEATDYNRANGFNGVLDGMGHTLQFTLKSGGLVGMILGNATIKNLGVIYTDATSSFYGVFGYRAGGATVIENCYIRRIGNNYKGTSIFGIVACTNANLQLHNTVVDGANFTNDGNYYSKMYINEASTNAFVIYARVDKNALNWAMSANFTEVVDSNIISATVSDLSSFDTNCWTITKSGDNKRIAWAGTADTIYTTVTITVS